MPDHSTLTNSRHASFHFIWLVVLFKCMMGCVTPKQLSYFQDDGINQKTISLDSLYNNALNAPVSRGLILTIRVNSITAPGSTTANPFEPIIIPGRPTDPPTTTGYLVDDEGNLTLPLIGTIPAAGKTTNQLATQIRAKLQTHLKDPTVTVAYTTRISVLGEVNRPSVFVLNYPVISLPEALGLAGDLTTYARRDNILVIRTINSKLVVCNLNR